MAWKHCIDLIEFRGDLSRKTRLNHDDILEIARPAVRMGRSKTPLLCGQAGRAVYYGLLPRRYPQNAPRMTLNGAKAGTVEDGLGVVYRWECVRCRNVMLRQQNTPPRGWWSGVGGVHCGAHYLDPTGTICDEEGD